MTHLLVLVDGVLKLSQLLFDLLLHTVQPLGVGSVHLLLAVLFLLGGLGDLGVHVDDRLDEQRRGLGRRGEGRGEGLMTGDETDELVEFWRGQNR